MFEQSASQAKSVMKKERARQKAIGAKQIQEAEYATARQRAAEEAKARVFGMLGKPSGGLFGTSGGPVGTSGIFRDPSEVGTSEGARGFVTGGVEGSKKQKRAEKQVGKLDEFLSSEAQKSILDPDAYAAMIAESTPFQIQSKLVGEAQQLLNKEGPAWDMLQNSVIGNISENAAELTRESLRQVRNQAAKGGSGRRQALAEAQSILAREAGMRLKAQETWRANLALHEFTRNFATSVQAQTTNFLDNLPLVNNAYQTAMTNITELMTRSILPGISEKTMEASKEIAKYTAQETGSFAENLITGVVSMVPYVGPVVGGALGTQVGQGQGGGLMGGMGGSMSLGALMGGAAGIVGEATPGMTAGGAQQSLSTGIGQIGQYAEKIPLIGGEISDELGKMRAGVSRSRIGLGTLPTQYKEPYNRYGFTGMKGLP